MAYYRNTKTGEKWVKDGLGTGRSYARMALMFLIIFFLVAIYEAVVVVFFPKISPCFLCFGNRDVPYSKTKPKTAAKKTAKPKSKQTPPHYTNNPNELFDGTGEAMKELGKLP
jgi:hypothetical protein